MLRAQLIWHPMGLRPAARAVVAALADAPLTALSLVQVAASGLDEEELSAVLHRLAEADALHAEATMAAVAAVEERGGRMDGDRLAALEARLRAEPDPRLRRIGLAALVGLARVPRGWNQALLERLAQYRADPHPLVAAAAWYTLPNVEEQPA